MSLLEQLRGNRGCLSSALGKSLAGKFFGGDMRILDEAVELLTYDDKNVRAGAAVIIEEIANERPELVAKRLEDILPGLETPEPQTRWITLRILGKCSRLNPEVAGSAMNRIDDFLADNSLCLQDSAITYLGYIGSLSNDNAKTIFPILEETLDSVPKRIPRVFESYRRMIPVLNDEKGRLSTICEKYSKNSKPSIAKAAKRTLKEIE
jgi:hypothetical protein